MRLHRLLLSLALCGAAFGQIVTINNEVLSTARTKINSNFSYVNTQLGLKSDLTLSNLSNAGTARTNLGLAIGTNVQAYNAFLADLSALTATNATFPMFNGTTLVGVAVPDCANATTGKLLFTAASRTFTCGTDQNSGSGGVADPAANGLMARTSANVSTARTITSSDSTLTITNGDGVSGNPVAVVNSAKVPLLTTIQAGTPLKCTDAGASGTAYTCGLTPALTAYSGIAGGMLIFTPNTSCAGGSTTINVDSIGTRQLYKVDGATNPAANDCRAGQPMLVLYNTALNGGLGGFQMASILGNAAGGSSFVNVTESAGTTTVKDPTASTGVTVLDLIEGAGQSSAGLLNFKRNNGTVGAYLRMRGDTTSQFYADHYTVNNDAADFEANLSLANLYEIKWTSGAQYYSGSPDTGLKRGAAGVLKVTDGSTGLGKIAVSQSTPSASSDACTAGSIWADASFIYACTASGTIKRAALSTF